MENFGDRMSLLRLFKAATSDAAAASPTGCARLRTADIALRGAMAAAHIAKCDVCRAEHLAVRAALACLVAGSPRPRESKPAALRVIEGGREA